MATKNKLKKQYTAAANEEEATKPIIFPPLSPASSALASTSTISLTVMPVFMFETPIHESRVIELLRNVIVPLNDRFSSIVHMDKKGILRWKKVDDMKIEDHVVALSFPVGLSPKEYEQRLQDYVSNISGEGFPKNRPLWEVHVIKGSWSDESVGAVVFKFSHIIGDGYSFLSLVFNGFKRADDPSLPLTFPNVIFRSNVNGGKSKCWDLAKKGFNTVPNAVRILSTALCFKDHRSVVRSGKPGIGLEPIAVSSITWSLEELKLIKTKVKGSVNDVITGIIHYAIHLYMTKKGENSSGKRMTSLIMLNMRVLRGFKNIDEMMKAEIWGNRTTHLQVPIPSSPDHSKPNFDPLDFIFKAKKNMKRMKNSLVAQLTFPLLHFLQRFRGPQGVAAFTNSIFSSSTTLITNVIGPSEKMSMAGYPISDCYYIVAGVPQSLTFFVVSWMGKLKVSITTEKEFIDNQLLISCMDEALQKIVEAACLKDMKD